ncbi:hypothetical protein TrCOL_g11227 [Triparma columacea]|uniref:DNA-directed RNA polymerases I, II, and III subunit RPABC3 n=1 Tax=Triparma columacea TaxID=722753 RepID=A0A9W7GM12_9STRA|nr:hypothetical protein TrCOL_g11227 [Triparma columacea]
MSKVTLFEDIFSVTQLNPEGKKFEKVDRLSAEGTSYNCKLLLDFNSEIYRIPANSKISLLLASTLSLAGDPSSPSYDQSLLTSATVQGDKSIVGSLADNYEYVMHGKVFSYEHKGGDQVEIDISYGGLLMRLRGDHMHLKNIEPDSNLYLLIKR